jgi:6-phosphofructokinase 1
MKIKKSSEPSKIPKKEEKKSAIIVAAEGIGDNRQLANESEKATSAEVKLSVLGYKQRGGNSSARSRLLANLFSDKAVELLSEGQRSEAFVLRNGEITSIGLEESSKTEKPLDLSLLNLVKRISDIIFRYLRNGARYPILLFSLSSNALRYLISAFIALTALSGVT